MTGSNYEGFLKSGIIEDVVLAKEWTLNDVLNMEKSIDDIVQILINQMDAETKFLIIKDTEYSAISNEILTMGTIISMVLREELSDMVSFIVNQYLKEAKVSFNDNNDKQRVEKVEKKVERPEDNTKEDEKIVSLKERIKQDTKQLNTKEMKKKGMI